MLNGCFMLSHDSKCRILSENVPVGKYSLNGFPNPHTSIKDERNKIYASRKMEYDDFILYDRYIKDAREKA